jgi:hypothetical protein
MVSALPEGMVSDQKALFLPGNRWYAGISLAIFS